MSEECSDCGTEMESVTLDGGGRIGYFCQPCNSFKAEKGLKITWYRGGPEDAYGRKSGAISSTSGDSDE